MMIAEVGENGTIRTDNLGNKRYAGSNPNNWVCFGTKNETCDEEHLYRIIGVIDGKMKIIKNSFYSTSKAWDTTNSNNWDRPATLNTELNGTSFYENTDYIDEVSKSYIANGTWYIGGQNGKDYTLASFEDNERTLSSRGYIGLMGVTDYGYASNNVGCGKNTNLDASNHACMNNNYLFNKNIHQWTITPFSGYASVIWLMRTGADVSDSNVYRTYGVRPVLYLESTVKITDGIGTEQEPYQLSM